MTPLHGRKQTERLPRITDMGELVDVDPELRRGGLRIQPSPDRTTRAREALVAYLRLLAVCIEEEAEMIDSQPDRAADVLRRFRHEVLDMSLGDAPVEALIQRGVHGKPNRQKPPAP
jgi:hypothetical protein